MSILERFQILKKIVHLLLFILTFVTTTLAGVQWLNQDPTELSNFMAGLPYSMGLLSILTFHEFGHYFAARKHGIDTTLPYYIPVPTQLFFLNPFGTMGAIIRIRSPLQTRTALFDIGIAGPLAGLLPAFGLLLYGFLTLPPESYLRTIHPEYAAGIPASENGFAFGHSLATFALSALFGENNFIPPMTEIYHYPYLCAGWFGLFITALNLIPVGQLDGGHIMYAMAGARVQSLIARCFFILLIVVGLAGLLPASVIGMTIGTPGWLLWAAILYFVIKLDHPEIPGANPISGNRKNLGWLTFIIFILIFPPVPFLN